MDLNRMKKLAGLLKESRLNEDDFSPENERKYRKISPVLDKIEDRILPTAQTKINDVVDKTVLNLESTLGVKNPSGPLVGLVINYNDGYVRKKMKINMVQYVFLSVKDPMYSQNKGKYFGDIEIKIGISGTVYDPKNPSAEKIKKGTVVSLYDLMSSLRPQ